MLINKHVTVAARLSMTIVLLVAVSAHADVKPTSLEALADYYEKMDETALYKEIRKEATKRHVLYRLEVGNPLHYQFMLKSRIKGGDSETKSPQQFKELREAHETHFKKLLENRQEPNPAKEVISAKDGEFADFNALTGVARVPTADGDVEVSAGAISSVYGKSIKSFISLTFREKGTGIIKGGATDFTFDGGTNFRLKAQATVSEDMVVETVALFEYTRLNDSTHDPEVRILIAGDEPAIADACMSAPNHKGQTDCTNKLAYKRGILYCWSSQANERCDYHDPGQKYRHFIPFKGTVDLETPAAEFLQGSLNISLIHPFAGGRCQVYNKEHGDLRDWKGAGEKRLSFDYPAILFDRTRSCMENLAYFDVDLWFSARIDRDGDRENPLVIKFTSLKSDVDDPNVIIIPRIVFSGFHVAKGTLIRTDNGEKAVEEIKADDLVETRDGYRKVISPTTGKEESLLKIVTEDGKTLEVTRSHPMILGNGVQLIAEKLNVGDELVTYASSGQSTLTRIKSVGYPKGDKSGEKKLNDVFNLVLEPSKDGTPGTYYANGILTGDANLQTELKYASHRTPLLTEAAKRASIPARYLEDYDNARK
ncbi:TPA: hypothetical protein ACKP22_000347 [Pseudomonas putida]